MIIILEKLYSIMDLQLHSVNDQEQIIFFLCFIFVELESLETWNISKIHSPFVFLFLRIVFLLCLLSQFFPHRLSLLRFHISLVSFVVWYLFLIRFLADTLVCLSGTLSVYFYLYQHTLLSFSILLASQCFNVRIIGNEKSKNRIHFSLKIIWARFLGLENYVSFTTFTILQ